MTGILNPLRPERRPSRVAVLVCCLLTLAASFDVSFLSGLFDPHVPHAGLVVSSVPEDPLDDDDTMLPTPTEARAAGRQEGEQSSCGGLVTCVNLAAPPLSASCISFTSPPSRAGGEHARRNGI